MKTLLFLIPLLFFSCSKQKTVSGVDVEQLRAESDFTKMKTGEEHLRLLNGYDFFEFKKISDSALIMDAAFFRGWKKKSYETTDTLRLTENYLVQDTVKNQTTQIVTYSSGKVLFQLLYSCTAYPATANEPHISKSYNGKLFIGKKDFNYFADSLYYK